MRKLTKPIVFVSVLALMLAFSMSGWAQESGKININTATVEELVKMKRVGQKYAEKIVAYREANGPFKAPEELMNVKGIGKKILEENMEIIVVE